MHVKVQINVQDQYKPTNYSGQTRSRRTSVSSNENGSLTRDVHLSDFAFVEQLEDFRRQLLDLRKDKKKQEDEIIKYKLLCKEKHQNIQVSQLWQSGLESLFLLKS